MIAGYHPVQESRIIVRFSSTDGLPLVLAESEPGTALLAVEKIDSAQRVLDIVAAISYETGTGRIREHRVHNERRQWRDQQIDAWLPLAQAHLVGHVVSGANPPGREDVDIWWRAVIDGKVSRDVMRDRVRPWVESYSHRINDPKVRSALNHLYSFALRYANQDKGITCFSGDGPFAHSDTEITEAYAKWNTRQVPQ